MAKFSSSLGMNTKMDTVLIVGIARGYLLSSIRDKMMEAHLNVEIAENMDQLTGKMNGTVTGVLIYGDESIVMDKQLLVYIKDKTAEMDIPIFVAGNNDDLENIKAMIPVHLISLEFLRPINAKDMVTEISEFLASNDKKQKKKILVVDDSGVMLHSIKGWLGDIYQITLADSGLSAIKYMTLNRPDLILLDYEMPICDGRQTLEMIRSEKEFASIPVIFLTGKGDRESIMQVMSLRPEGYLLKTMKPDDIKTYIANFFEKQKLGFKK